MTSLTRFAASISEEPATTGPGPEPSVHDGTIEVDPVAALLAQVREDALQFLARVPHPPTALRIQVGEVSLELEWQQGVGAVPGLTPTAGPALSPAPIPAPATAAAAQATAAAAQEHELCAPSVGVFYRSPAPGEAPFVAVGDTVSAGQQVGIVEVMKLMIPVEADRAGVVLAVMKESGDAVEYDEPLMTLAPHSG